MSTICRGGLIVSITHLTCNFLAANALMAQRYPSRLYAKLVVQFNVLGNSFFLFVFYN